MKILQQPVKARKGQVITVHFDQPTKVKLLKHNDFLKYKGGKTHNYRGGHYIDSPAVFPVPADGLWHAVIEKGTYNNPLNVTGSVELGEGDSSIQASAPVHEPEAIAAHDEVAEETTNEEVVAAEETVGENESDGDDDGDNSDEEGENKDEETATEG
jgi:hypothetical protein